MENNIELNESENKIEFPKPKVKPSFCHRGSFGDEPQGIIIINSGWQGMCHVIIEFGDFEDYTHQFMSSESIEKEYGLKIEDVNMKELSFKYPNDHDFGKFIRNKIHAII
jgi:hypothetical protein